MKKLVFGFLVTVSFAVNAQVKVTSNGNVGIGTVTPISQLHIKTGGNVTLQRTNNWQWAGCAIDFMNYNNIYNGKLLFTNDNYPRSSFHLYVNTVNGLKESVKLDNNGTMYVYGQMYQLSTWL